MSSAEVIRAAPIVACRPWPRYVLAAEAWAALAPDGLVLEALWADTTAVYALFTDAAGQPLFASVATQNGRYAALSPLFPDAAAPERMVRDLWGHEAEGAADCRPWLDHGRWGFTRPMAPRHGPPASSDPAFRPPAFPPGPEGPMQWGMGPVTGRLDEPVHLRVATDGRVTETVEARLGYAHKGTLLLVRGKSPRAAARFVARLAAGATVAHALAFARATEAAVGLATPARAAKLRDAMAEIERIASHLSDLAACCPGVPGFGWHREQLLRATAVAFGHRMMMDCVVPGGVAADIAPAGAACLLASLDGLEAAFAKLSRQIARVGDGVADVPARLQRRLLEMEQSIALLQAWLPALPSGPAGQTLPTASGEGLGMAESARGPVWHWLRLDGGTIGAAFFADPAWRSWPAQEAASQGVALTQLALLDAAFGCTRSGIDL